MTVGQLKQILEYVPNTHEVLIMLNGQKDIFTIVDEIYQGEYRPWLDSPFDAKIGEVVESKKKNCIALARIKE